MKAAGERARTRANARMRERANAVGGTSSQEDQLGFIQWSSGTWAYIDPVDPCGSEWHAERLLSPYKLVVFRIHVSLQRGFLLLFGGFG